MSRVSRGLDRIVVTFDDTNLVANAGLLLAATLADRFDLEALVNSTVGMAGRVGGALPGRKVLTWCTQSWPAPPTSTTRMCCERGTPPPCSGIG